MDYTEKERLYHRDAWQHMKTKNMAFCFGVNGQMLTIGNSRHIAMFNQDIYRCTRAECTHSV